MSDRPNTPKTALIADPERAPRFRLTPSGGRLLVTVVGAACAIVVLTIPQASLPAEMPALEVDGDAFEAALRRDTELAASPIEGPLAERLRSLLDEQGRAEAGRPEPVEAEEERRLALRRLRALIEREGEVEERRASLRASAAVRLWPALRGQLEHDAEQAVLGSFPRMLARYAAARDGRVVAPYLVVHAMYKARFNFLVGVDPTDGFTQSEKHAYWGWVATSAPDAPESLIRQAVREYAAAGGRGARELQAIAAARDGRPAIASRMFSRLYDETGLLRYRNYSRGTLYLAGAVVR